MTKKQKIRIIAIFLAAVIIVAGIAIFLNIRETQEGIKRFQIEVISDRDSFSKTTKLKSDSLYLGAYLRLTDDCEGEDSGYGFYVTGWYGMKEDISQEYWWNLSINGENAVIGVDEVPLLEGDIYTFTLMQGWDMAW